MRLSYAIVIMLLLSACVKDRFADVNKQPDQVDIGDRTVVHYWNFNKGSSFQDIIVPTLTKTNASLSYSATGDPVSEGTTLNAINNDEAGAALRLRNPAGQFILHLPTTDCKNVVLMYACMRTDNGAQESQLSYTIDGTNYIATGLKQTLFSVGTIWQVYAIDFSAIEGVNNNPDFKVAIDFRIGNTNESGNNRFDNITMYANYTAPDVPLTLLHYWNFNDNTDASYTIGDAAWEFTTGGAYNVDNGVDGTALNARNSDAAGAALRLRETKDGNLILSLPSKGYEQLKLSMAVTSTTSENAPVGGTITYTTDGVNYTNEALSKTAFTIATRETFQLETFDFSTIAGANNNPNFKVKVSLTMPNATANSGNLRVDNITLEGAANDNLPAPPPAATIDTVLLHYWNFNTGIDPTYTYSSASWIYTTTGTVNTDATVTGTDINAQNGDVAGLALRLRETINGEFVLTVPTTGYQKVFLDFAATSTTSNSAPDGGTISYSIDGTNFITTDNVFTITTRETYQQVHADFSSITGANNNANFKVKVSLKMPNATANAGNLRVDNITLKGIKR